MKRRDFLRSPGTAFAGLAISKAIPLFGDTATAAWRTFEVTTRVEVLKPSGATRIWLPTPLVHDTPFQKTRSNKFAVEGGSAKLTEDKTQLLGIVSTPTSPS